MLNQLQPFIPTKDFELSKAFYRDLGFKVIYEDDHLILYEKDAVRLFLQRFYERFFAENMVFQMYTDDIFNLHKHVQNLKQTYSMIQVSEIKIAHYGATFTLHDPSGVLFHMTNPTHK